MGSSINLVNNKHMDLNQSSYHKYIIVQDDTFFSCYNLIAAQNNLI